MFPADVKARRDRMVEESGAVTHPVTASRRGMTMSFKIPDSRLQIGGRARPRMVSLVESVLVLRRQPGPAEQMRTI